MNTMQKKIKYVNLRVLKMKKLYLVIFLIYILISIPLISFSTEIDSLSKENVNLEMRALLKEKRYEEIVVLAKNILNDIEKNEMLHHNDYYDYITNVLSYILFVGMANSNLKDFEGAQQYYDIFLSIAPKYYGNKSHEIKNYLDDISVSFSARHEYSLGIKYLEMASEIEEWHNGDNHVNLLSEIAYLYARNKQYQKSMESYEYIFKKNENKGNYPISIFDDYNHSFVKFILDDKEEAVKYIDKFIYNNKKFNIVDSNTLVSYIENAAMYYSMKNYYFKSNEYLQKIISILESKSNGDEFTKNKILFSIAKNYQFAGLYKNAREYYDKLLFAMIGKLDQMDSEELKWSVDVFLQSGSLYQDIGDYKKAEESYLIGIQFLEELYGENNVNLVNLLTGYNNLSTLYSTIGANSKAIELYEKSIDISTNFHGENNIRIATYLTNISGIYYKIHDYEKALHFAIKGLDLKIKHYGNERLILLNSYHALGTLYSAIQQYDISI